MGVVAVRIALRGRNGRSNAKEGQQSDYKACRQMTPRNRMHDDPPMAQGLWLKVYGSRFVLRAYIVGLRDGRARGASPRPDQAHCLVALEQIEQHA